MTDTPPPLQDPSSSRQPSQSSGSGGKVAMGCGLGCIVTLVVAGIAAFFLFQWGTGKLKEFAEQFTAEEPVEIAEPSIPPAEVEDAVARYDAFRAAVKNDEKPPPLVLSEADINALVQNHPDFEGMPGEMNVVIEDDELSSQMSLSLDGFPIPLIGGMVEGRYFNGEATFRVATENGEPALYIEGLEANGRAVPEEAMNRFGRENLLKEASSDPKMKRFFDRIETLAIEDGELKIIPVEGGAGATAQPGAGANP